ncbi:MAG TPA: MFS transporter, partial [Tepidiformaceae bacterium]|nr:MFS transporter [Tepidiformaceae bacterium]
WLVVFHALGDASDPDVRASAMAYVGLTSAAATATGFGIAAVVGETPYWPAAFIVAILFAAASGLLLTRLYPVGSKIGRLERVFERGGELDRKVQYVAGAVIFAHFVAVTATIAAFGPFVLRTLDLTLLRAGGVLVPAAGAAALGMFLAGRWSRRGNRLREVAVLYALGSGAVLAAAAVHNPWLFGLVAIPLAFSVGGAQPLLNASLLDVSHSADQTGTVLGWLFFAEGLGSVTGPVIIGAVISVSGVRDAVVAISILDACIVALAIAGSKATRL